MPMPYLTGMPMPGLTDMRQEEYTTFYDAVAKEIGQLRVVLEGRADMLPAASPLRALLLSACPLELVERAAPTGASSLS